MPMLQLYNVRSYTYVLVMQFTVTFIFGFSKGAGYVLIKTLIYF